MPFLSYNTQKGIFQQMTSLFYCKVTAFYSVFQEIR